MSHNYHGFVGLVTPKPQQGRSVTTMPKTERLIANATGIARAATLLRGGGLVAFPTETVYGLGADATDDRAVARIFAAKGRPQFNPLIVHVASVDQARAIGVFNETAEQLAQAFWPGALTLVLPLRANAGIAPLVSAGLPSIAIRVPDHALAQDLLRQVGKPIAAPSANPSGKISPTNAQHVFTGLDGLIEAVLDGGPCPVGLESTIVGLKDGPTLLRPGGLPAEAIEACLGASLARDEGETLTAPGQMASHYAPDASIRLNANTARPGELHIGFGGTEGDLTLSTTGDLTEAAARLFHILHQANRTGKPIALAPVPDHGLGRAINDRLRRAAAPR